MSIYWAIVTATTIGYGDLYPTTPLGRVVSVCLMYMGIIAIALPISIVGSSFDREYKLVHHKKDSEDAAKYGGTEAESRREMMKHMQEMTQAMQEINSRMEAISAYLVRQGEKDGKGARDLTLSLAGTKKNDSPIKNKILEISSKKSANE